MNMVYDIASCLIGIGLLCGFYRLYVGPNTLNRILAFDFIAASLVALTVVYSIRQETTEYLELVLLFSLFGFATVVAFMEVFFARSEGESS